MWVVLKLSQWSISISSWIRETVWYILKNGANIEQCTHYFRFLHAEREKCVPKRQNTNEFPKRNGNDSLISAFMFHVYFKYVVNERRKTERTRTHTSTHTHTSSHTHSVVRCELRSNWNDMETRPENYDGGIAFDISSWVDACYSWAAEVCPERQKVIERMREKSPYISIPSIFRWLFGNGFYLFIIRYRWFY